MSFKRLQEQVAENRAEAQRVIAEFRTHRDEVNKSTTLTTQGKEEYLAPLKAERDKKLETLRKREEQLVADEATSLSRRVYGTAGSSPESVISFRDAQERAAALESSMVAQTAMQRALLSNDSGLAQAILGRSIDMLWEPVSRLYLETHPAASEAVQDLSALTRWRNDTAQHLLGGLNYHAS